MTAPAQREVTKQLMLLCALHVALFWLARTAARVSDALDDYEALVFGSLPATSVHRERFTAVLDAAQEQTHLMSLCLMACCLALGLAATILSAVFGR